MRRASMEVMELRCTSVPQTVEVKSLFCCETAAGDMGDMDNPGYCSGTFDGLQHPSDDDDDEMVDIAGATLDFSTTDDVPPLNAGKLHL